MKVRLRGKGAGGAHRNGRDLGNHHPALARFSAHCGPSAGHLPVADPDAGHLLFLLEEARPGGVKYQQAVRSEPPHFRPWAAPGTGRGGTIAVVGDECVGVRRQPVSPRYDGDLGREAGGGAAVPLEHHRAMQSVGCIGTADRAVRAAIGATAQ